VLCNHNGGSEKNWFAICDPFSVPDLSAKIPEQTGDDICVVGCLVNKLPVWIYNPDTTVLPVTKEADLGRYKANIKKLVCYKEGTTGHLIAKRLHRSCFQDSNLEAKEFGQEFASSIGNDVAVVTSDILRIVHSGLSDRKIIFNYPTRSPNGLSPFLFTGILTLKNEVLDANLWVVLSILAGIKHAMDLLRLPTVPQDCVDVLIKRFQPQLLSMNVTDAKEQERIIRTSINCAFHTWQLYSENLKPEKEAWDNAKNEWEQARGQQFADTEERNEPIPSLLIKKSWRRDAELRSHINKGFVDPATMLKSDMIMWYHKYSPAGAILLAFFSLIALLSSCQHATKPFDQNWAFIIAASVAFSIQVGATVKLSRDALSLETKSFVTCWSIALGLGLATLVTSIEGIK
jgi:hypothetical protein